LTAKKTAAANGNLQPEIKLNEYPSSKKLLVVYYSSNTLVLAAALARTSVIGNNHQLLSHQPYFNIVNSIFDIFYVYHLA